MRPKTCSSFLFFVILSLCRLEGGEAFEQLGTALPTPTESRLASGAPGPAYWQQEANYVIEVELDEEAAMIRGSERIEYINHSPHELAYVWVQLDQNMFSKDSKGALSDQGMQLARRPGDPTEALDRYFRGFLYQKAFEGGHRIGKVEDGSGSALDYVIVDTNMRIDLPEPLPSGESLELNIDWEYPISDEAYARRTGRKKLKSGDYAYQIAQWYPRMCAYYEEQGWQVKPYMNQGEFALEFGRFEVSITVPEDFVVAATGVLTNPEEVLSSTELDRLEEARDKDKPVMIVTEEEAAAKLDSPKRGRKTWRFEADNVRDYAFAASRGYQWDAMGVSVGDEIVMAMSAYPKEAAPIWERYSTEAVALTLDVYSEVVYEYPYPVAWSTWGPVGGMEYPMVSFQSSWEIDEKGTYPESVRNYVIGVIVHEVGHVWFPMIINSDERQWMWMDEGLNSFVEDIATSQFGPRMQRQYLNGVKRTIAKMAESNDPIIMTAADNLTQRGYQAYSKPALALTVLREGVMGRELFDFAFREYAQRWAFKRPLPSDFFRTMEDASGVDLDWFWKGWFYTNDHVDFSVESVESFVLDDGNPESSKAMARRERDEYPDTPLVSSLKDEELRASLREHLQDWYYSYDEYAATEKEIEKFEKGLEELEDWQRELREFSARVHVVEVANLGGLAMPMVLDVSFADGTERRIKVPAEIWRYGDSEVRVPFVSRESVLKVELDRDNAFADADLENNVYPRPIREGRFKIKADEKDDNPMYDALYPDGDDNDDEEEDEE